MMLCTRGLRRAPHMPITSACRGLHKLMRVATGSVDREAIVITDEMANHTVSQDFRVHAPIGRGHLSLVVYAAQDVAFVACCLLLAVHVLRPVTGNLWPAVRSL